MLIYSSPQLIAVSHVLLRLPMPRHSPYALFRLNFLKNDSLILALSSQIIFRLLFFTVNFAFCAKCSFFTNYTEKPCVISFLLSKITLVFSQLSVSFSFFIRFSMNILQSTRFKCYSNQCIATRRCGLVGSSGLEPPTSRLSGVRSTHLSYEPVKNGYAICFTKRL